MSELRSFNREQELVLAAAIVQHPVQRAEWWAIMIEWAKKDFKGQEPKVWSRGLIRGVYEEAVQDSFRLPRNQRLTGVSHEGTNQEIFSQYYGLLINIDGWELESGPDVPVAFLRKLAQEEGHPLLAVIEHLGWIALGRVTNAAIRNMWMDSPITQDVIAFVLAKSQPEMKERIGVTWSDGDPIASILERGTFRFNRLIDNLNLSEHDGESAVHGGIFEGLLSLSEKPMSELLRRAGQDALVKCLGTSVSNDLKDVSRSRKRIRKLEDTESDIDWRRESLGEWDGTSFLDTLASREPDPSKSLDQREVTLEELDLDLNDLTTGELNILEEVIQGQADGYALSDKGDMSFTQYWGEEYPKKIKAWDRCRKKLKMSIAT